MKGILSKRWHGIPVGIVTAVLLVCMLAGGALAAYAFWGGSAKVTVAECMTVTNLTGDDGDFDASTLQWAVSIKPGETKTLNVRVSNSSSAALTATLTVVESYTDLAAAWTPASAVIPGGSYVNFTLSVSANGDSVPDVDYAIPLFVSRQ